MPNPCLIEKIRMKEDTQLARWLAGEMDAAELELFQKTPEYALYWRINNNFTKLESPQFNADRILEAVLKQEKNPIKTIPLYQKLWFRAAAVIVILLGIGLTFTLMPTRKVANYGETFSFALPDSSEVLLNSGSKVDYSIWNWDSNREVRLDGEAYFKVAKGKKFVVKTTLGMVTVMGTKFNVRSRNKRFEVICYEGKVAVKFEQSQTVLTPNQSIVFNQGITTGKEIMKGQEPRWIHDELVFSQESLADIIAEIERKYAVKIRNTVTATQLFSGSIPGNDLDAALSVLSVTFHLKAIKNNDNITLIRNNENL